MPIHQLTLVTQKNVAKHTMEYTFEKPLNFHFLPGQYGGFTLINKETNQPITRRFSLLSAPHEPIIRIAMRIQPSPFKNAMLELRPGDTIKFAGPSGQFVLHEDSAIPAVFIAGGIGITPFYSMIQHASQNHSTRAITLFYGNNTLEESAYLDDFYAYKKQNAAFTFIPTLQHPPADWADEKGFITASLIEHYIDCSQPVIFYVCGSLSMVQAIQQTLKMLEIPDNNIKAEDFPGY